MDTQLKMLSLSFLINATQDIKTGQNYGNFVLLKFLREQTTPDLSWTAAEEFFFLMFTLGNSHLKVNSPHKLIPSLTMPLKQI